MNQINKYFKRMFFMNITILFILFIASSAVSCKGSYFGGYALQPDTTRNLAVFHEIYDQDSTIHWYIHMYEGENWCLRHNQYEEVKNVRR